MNIIKLCNKVIEYSFYSLLFFVPLVFTSETSELFEFNKMWLTFLLTLLIGSAWISKMIITRKFRIQKTIFDIPILLFLLSQLIATFHTLDSHVSWWGYYSRFNGGFLSILTYVFLYYAFVSNFAANATAVVKRMLIVSLAAGTVVALWGLPSHFGYDPTCFLFRGTFDVSCWTDAFQPKIRMFSTLGQPDWLSAYLAILLPISIVLFLQYSSRLLNPEKKNHESTLPAARLPAGQGRQGIMSHAMNKSIVLASCFLLLASLFYVDLTWTDSRSGFLAFWAAFIVLASAIVYKNGLKQSKALGILVLGFLVLSFFIRTPFRQLDFFSLQNVQSHFAKPSVPKPEAKPQKAAKPPVAGELGGTDSTKIRAIVWKGAIDAWKHNMLFGTGVETFAFAYYLYRPPEHNLTSEWDFLYNKAHNEYLNYLTTTGAFGLGSYFLMNLWFLFYVLKEIKNQKSKIKNAVQNSKLDKGRLLALNSNLELCILNFALTASYISIMITNFFGFSVVITNIYLFLIPAFFGILTGIIKHPSFKTPISEPKPLSPLGTVGILAVFGLTIYAIILLISFWLADKSYALGYNLDRVNEYPKANQLLKDAISLRNDEPVFKDELSINEGVLAVALLSQKDPEAQTTASQLTQEAIALSNDVVSAYPNNVVFLKTRVRLFYALSQIDPKFLSTALEAIEKAHKLAPTDAKISYNLGVLYGQGDQTQKAAEVLQETIRLKPDYRDAYFALGLMYHTLAIDKNGKVIDPQTQKLAVDALEYILKNLVPNDTQTKDALKSWGEPL